MFGYIRVRKNVFDPRRIGSSKINISIGNGRDSTRLKRKRRAVEINCATIRIINSVIEGVVDAESERNVAFELIAISKIQIKAFNRITYGRDNGGGARWYGDCQKGGEDGGGEGAGHGLFDPAGLNSARRGFDRYKPQAPSCFDFTNVRFDDFGVAAF